MMGGNQAALAAGWPSHEGHPAASTVYGKRGGQRFVRDH